MDEDDPSEKVRILRTAQNIHYLYTHEELKVLRQCDKESFWYRCVPLSGLLGGITLYIVRVECRKPNRRLGGFLKVFISVVMGYFFGKISYTGRCEEKMMDLPGSRVGEFLRQKREGNMQRTFDPRFGLGFPLPPYGKNPPKQADGEEEKKKK